MSDQNTQTEYIISGVDYPVTLAIQTTRRIKVRGVVVKVTCACTVPALSEAEFKGIF